MAADYFIGIDIGTGSTKAIAVDRSAKTLATSREAYPTNSPKPSWSEQNPASILVAFKSCIRQITDKLGSPGAISLSSAMHSVIPVDENCTALAPMITWADNRSEEVAERLKVSGEGKFLYEKGGTPIHSMTPICKIIWIRENDPVLFSKVKKFVSIKEYIWFHLLGEFEVDYSIASATGMFDVLKLTWNPGALEVAGIPAEKLSLPVNTNTINKHVSASIASELGIAANTPFVIGSSDGCLANLGSQATDEGIASLTIGTSGAIRVASKTPVSHYDSMPFNYLLDEKTFICGGPINNGGVALKWYAEKVLRRELKTPAHYAELLSQLNETPAGSDGLIFLPYILGERAPIWNSSASGVFFGITAAHGQEHFTRAVLEGISMALYNVGRTLENGGLVIKKINVSGGFVQNEEWLQLLADIFGKDICLINAEDASALGAIFLAMKALGVIDGYEQFRSGAVKTFTPDEKAHKIYREISFPRYLRLYQNLKAEMGLVNDELTHSPTIKQKQVNTRSQSDCGMTAHPSKQKD